MGEVKCYLSHVYILMVLDKSDKERQAKNLSHGGTQVGDLKLDNY